MPAATDELARTARAMSEAELFKGVADALKTFGWRYFHIPATAYRKAGIPKGFPDITAVKDGHLVFIELKREREEPSEEQAAWISDLARHAFCGVEIVFPKKKMSWKHNYQVHIWRPSNLLSGEIAEILAGNR